MTGPRRERTCKEFPNRSFCFSAASCLTALIQRSCDDVKNVNKNTVLLFNLFQYLIKTEGFVGLIDIKGDICKKS